MKTIVGYCIWNTEENKILGRIFRREHDAYNSTVSYSQRHRPGKPRKPLPKDRAIVPVYVDEPGEPTPRICRCGRPENDHHVRHPFVPAL